MGASTRVCNSDCTLARCGDGKHNTLAGETCDDGNTNDQDDCLTTCRLNRCGDNSVDQQAPVTETCDDGNTTSETVCAYGSPTCTACDATCASVLDLTGPFCGDNTQNGPEACDDGNTTSETACGYGIRTCTRCSANCLNSLNLNGP